MEHKLLILLCALMISRDITSLPNKEDVTIVPYLKPYTGPNEQNEQYHVNKDHEMDTVSDEHEVEIGSQEMLTKENDREDKGFSESMNKEKLEEVEDKIITQDELMEDETDSGMTNNTEFGIHRDRSQSSRSVKDIVRANKMIVDTGVDLETDDNISKRARDRFQLWDFARTPNPINVHVTRQSYTRMSPIITRQDLLYLNKRNDKTSDHEFQLPSPMREINEADKGSTEYPNTSKSTDSSFEETTADQEDDSTQESEIMATESSMAWNPAGTRNGDSPVGGNVPRRINGRLDQVLATTSRASVIKTGGTWSGLLGSGPMKDKLKVVTVYPEKKTPEPEAKPNKHSEYLDLYKKWIEKHGKPSVERTTETVSPDAVTRSPVIQSNETAISEAYRRPAVNKYELGIRNQIENKMNLKSGGPNKNMRMDTAGNIEYEEEISGLSLEDEIYHRMNNIKKSRYHENTKIDRLIVNIVKIVRKCNKVNKLNLNLMDCLKHQTLKSMESLMFNTNKSMPIVNNFIYLENDLPTNKTEFLIAENRYMSFDEKLFQAINTFLNHLSLKIKLPTDLLVTQTSALARHKKEKHGHMMMLMMLMAAGTMVPIKMSMIAMMAGKALLISVMSLTLAILIGLKKLSHGHGSGHTTYEVINLPGPNTGGPNYISRNLKYTTLATPTLGYLPFTSGYDKEHEGEVTPETGSATPTSPAEYASPDDEHEPVLSSYRRPSYTMSFGDRRPDPAESVNKRPYTPPIQVVETFTETFTHPTVEDSYYSKYGGAQKYTIHRDGMKLYVVPGGQEKNAPSSGGDKHYATSGGGEKNYNDPEDDRYSSLSSYSDRGGWIPKLTRD